MTFYMDGVFFLDKMKAHKLSISVDVGIRLSFLFSHVRWTYAATSAKDLLWLLTVPRCPRMNSIGGVLQPWWCIVLSNQVMMFRRLAHWIIRCSSVSGACWQSAQVLLVVWSSRWHLALVGRRRWLKRNIVCLIVGGKAAVFFQMESQSRCG